MCTVWYYSSKKIISFNFLRAGIQNIFFIKQRQFVAEAKRTAFWLNTSGKKSVAKQVIFLQGDISYRTYFLCQLWPFFFQKQHPSETKQNQNPIPQCNQEDKKRHPKDRGQSYTLFSPPRHLNRDSECEIPYGPWNVSNNKFSALFM